MQQKMPPANLVASVFNTAVATAAPTTEPSPTFPAYLAKVALHLTMEEHLQAESETSAEGKELVHLICPFCTCPHLDRGDHTRTVHYCQ